MEASFPLLFAALIGFTHAFEADHLVAVSSLVTKRNKVLLAIKDGIYWGLGHTSTIFLIGFLIIVGKATFLNGYFSYFEAGVGMMLIILGIYRLREFYHNRKNHKDDVNHEHTHRLAYGVGLIHGLAGSGALILLLMTEMQSSFNSMLYLIIFGIGSVVGMLVAAGIFSLPFSKKLSTNPWIQFIMILLSAVLCIGYGAFVMYENLLA